MARGWSFGTPRPRPALRMPSVREAAAASPSIVAAAGASGERTRELNPGRLLGDVDAGRVEVVIGEEVAHQRHQRTVAVAAKEVEALDLADSRMEACRSGRPRASSSMAYGCRKPLRDDVAQMADHHAPERRGQPARMTGSSCRGSSARASSSGVW